MTGFPEALPRIRRRTAGTIEMGAALMECGPCDDEKDAEGRLVEAVERVAERLGNTPAVCRECYIHPEIIDRYLDGTLAELLDPDMNPVRFEKIRGLTVEESAVLALLEAGSPGSSGKG